MVPLLIAADKPSDSPTVDRSADTPDFCQVDPAGHLPRGGNSYCGPVATSNALIYLARSGYPKLRPDARDDKSAQISLIQKIASPGFMNTDENAGTGPTGVMKGIKKYVEAAGYRVNRIEFQGADKIKAFKCVAPIPTAAFLRDGLSTPNSAVLVNIAWKKLDPAKNIYTRIGGHWITIVGCGKNANGKYDPNAFTIHDPSPWSGMGFVTEHVTAEPIHGTFEIDKSNGQTERRSAEGYLEFKGEIKLKANATAAVINRAVLIVLNPPHTD